MASNGLLFTPDQSSGSGATDFIKDVFVDFTFPATVNTGLTDNSNTNPTGSFFSDSDQATFGSKVLWFKDIQLLDNRASWINSRPTSQITFTSGDFPAVKAFGYGNICKKSYYKDMVALSPQEAMGGFAVTGKIRRLTWLIQPSDVQTSKLGQLKTDGSNTTTIDLTGNASVIQNLEAQFVGVNHQASNETNDLHTFQIEDQNTSILNVMGVIVYFENTGANIQLNNGTTYVNKTKISSINGATMSIPTAGSSMGGQILITKTAMGYSAQVVGQTSVISTSQGVSGSNLISVATGTGSSFLAGHMIGLASGASPFLAQVTAISTDTLTVSPTLTFGYSNIPIYTCGRIGPTLAISNSSLKLKTVIDFGNFSDSGTTLRTSYYDMDQNVSLFLDNIGVTGAFNNRSVYFKGGSGSVVVNGKFAAAEIEMSSVTGATLSMTMSNDGLPGFTFAENSTGSIKRTFFTDGAPGGHMVLLSPGNSSQIFNIDRINLFENNINGGGITLGQIAQASIHQAFIPRTTLGATIMMIGAQRRIYGDQLYLKGAWSRGITSSAAGGIFYYGTSTNAILSQTYYGRQFAIIGTFGGGTLSIDGVGRALAGSNNVAIDPGTEGFHTVVYTSGTGATSTIEAFEFASSRGEISNLTNFDFKTTFVPKPVDSKVYAKYQNSSGQVMLDSTINRVVYNNLIFDDHKIVSQLGAGTGGVWQAIIPRDGFYSIITQVQYAATNNWTEALDAQIIINVNTNPVASGDWEGLSGNGVIRLVAIADVLKLKKGDQINIDVTQNTGSTLALNPTGSKNWITIKEL